MSANRREGEVVGWRYSAGPESLMYYEQDKRPSVTAWTADRSGVAKRGDFVVLYGTGRLQKYVAIARICCEPKQNDKTRRRIVDRDFWTYLQVQPLARTVPRSEVEKQDFAMAERSGLKTPRGGQANRIASAALTPLLNLLVSNDPVAHKHLASWRPGGRGAWPRGLDMEELRWSDWAPPDKRTAAELNLCRKLAATLVKTGRYRYLRRDDGVGIPPASFRDGSSGLSLEHQIRDLVGHGRIDILLVDDTAIRPTLLVIEVKIRASLAVGRNPVPQAVRYRAALAMREGDRYVIRPLVVAEHFDPLVLDEARSRGIESRRCTPSRGKLSPPLD